jgi:hypothetical protein
MESQLPTSDAAPCQPKAYRVRNADGAEQGPYSAAEVQQLIDLGQAFARTLATEDPRQDWRELQDFPEFRDKFPALPPPIGASNSRALRIAATVTSDEPMSNPLAKISLGFGIVATVFVIPFGWFFTIPAIVVGYLAGRHARETPNYAGAELAHAGCSLGYLSLFMLIAGVMCTPGFVKARTTAIKNACINNLRQIDGAKEQWALDNKKNAGDAPTESDLIGPDNYIRVMPVCPGGGYYAFNPIGTLPTCTIPAHSAPFTKDECAKNLAAIQNAKQLWATQNQKGEPAFADLAKYLNPKPACPVGGAYRCGSLRQNPQCSFHRAGE